MMARAAISFSGSIPVRRPIDSKVGRKLPPAGQKTQCSARELRGSCHHAELEEMPQIDSRTQLFTSFCALHKAAMVVWFR
jgi:hypothetical protein